MLKILLLVLSTSDFGKSTINGEVPRVEKHGIQVQFFDVSASPPLNLGMSKSSATQTTSNIRIYH